MWRRTKDDLLSPYSPLEEGSGEVGAVSSPTYQCWYEKEWAQAASGEVQAGYISACLRKSGETQKQAAKGGSGVIISGGV